MNWAIVASGTSIATLLTLIRLIYMAGKLVNRLEQVENDVKELKHHIFPYRERRSDAND